MVLAVVGLMAAGFAYTKPRPPWPAPAADQREPASAAARDAELCDASFLDPARGAVVLCATVSRRLHIFLTEDGGRTWRPGPSGLVAGAQVSWFDRRHLLLSGFGRQAAYMWATEDGGDTWGRRTVATPPASGAYAASLPLFGDPTWGLHAYLLDSAGSRGGAAPGRLELRLTQDGGRTWTPIEPAGVPIEGAKRLLGLWGTGHGYLQVSTSGRWPALLRTDDRGVSWTPADVPSPLPAPVQVGASGVLLGPGAEVFWVEDLDGGSADPGGGRIYTSRSLDGGRTWSPLRAGPTVSRGSQPRRDDRGRLWLLGRGRLWSSGDGGLDWVPGWRFTSSAGSGARLVFAGAGVVYAVQQPRGQRASLVRSTTDSVWWDTIAVPRVPDR